MKTKNIFILLAIVCVVVMIFYSFNDNATEREYTDIIKKERKEKDRYMQTADDSPFADSTSSFTALHYFEPDESFRIIAKLAPIKNRNVRVLGTSDGKEERYIEYAWASFDFGNRKNKLLILEVQEPGNQTGNLFLAFGDETSANETYGAGRYLDIKKIPGSATITLDFNKAYNPYCAYTTKYSCPFPPQENLLSIAIRAGEKKYHD